ncbi:MAG: C4-dicarboxylate ABC transporter [Desulfuromonas sp.]|nr:MAG: C4-dicarboxylate ABC transporter [Desulfuromonas sp.]
MTLLPYLLPALALIGAPLFAIIAAGAMLGFYSVETDLAVIAIEIYRVAEMPVLVAIPLFTFSGYLLGESRAPQRLVRLSEVFLGWLPGGLAVVALFACAFFTAFTGASGVTIVALGALLHPALKQAGYSPRFSLGLVTTSGSLGLLFAPSLPLILYGVVVQQSNLGTPLSIDQLFVAGLLPGLMMILLLVVYTLWHNRGLPRPPRPNLTEVGQTLRGCFWELPLPIVVLGGIYGGFFAISEAAAVTLLYIFLIEVIILREIPWRRVPEIIRQSMIMVGGILIILAVSLATTNYLIDTDVPRRLFETIREYVVNPLTFLILLNIFLLILGAILDIFSALILVVPLILPVAVGYGIDPIHLGIIFLANMQIGYLTPPVGLNLFIASYRFERPIAEIYSSTLPFLLILLLTVLLITYWPALSLCLVR